MSGGRVSKVVLGVVAITLLFAFSVGAAAAATTESITGTDNNGRQSHDDARRGIHVARGAGDRHDSL